MADLSTSFNPSGIALNSDAASSAIALGSDAGSKAGLYTSGTDSPTFANLTITGNQGSEKVVTFENTDTQDVSLKFDTGGTGDFWKLHCNQGSSLFRLYQDTNLRASWLDGGGYLCGNAYSSGVVDTDGWKFGCGMSAQGTLYGGLSNYDTDGRAILRVSNTDDDGSSNPVYGDIRAGGSSYSETLYGISMTGTFGLIGVPATGSQGMIIGVYGSTLPIQFGANGAIKFIIAGDGSEVESKVGIKFDEDAYFDAEYDNGNSSTADTVAWANGNKQKSTLTGNCTFTFTAPGGPTNLVLKLIQDATGSRTVTWPATVKWPSATAPTLSTGAADVDIICFYYDGTNYYGNSSLDFG